MSTLAEIEAAADSLPLEQKQELLFYVAARLRSVGVALPPPRQFRKEEMQGWIAEDQADSRSSSVRDFFGSFASDDTRGADNERIDADLAREAGHGL